MTVNKVEMLVLLLSSLLVASLQFTIADARNVNSQNTVDLLGGQSNGLSRLKRLLQDIIAERELEKENLGEPGDLPLKGAQASNQNPEYDVIASRVSSVAIPEDSRDQVYPSELDQLSILKRVLYNQDAYLSEPSSTPSRRHTKRTCRLRLGGHCNTEALDKAAKSYYYLKSGDSPGKRRRRSLRTLDVIRSRNV